jgi:serine/threonine protein kinase
MFRFTPRAGDEIADDLHAVRLLEAAFGYKTYIAWHSRLSALVVVKLAQQGWRADAGSLDGLRREATMLRTLAHPMLPRVFDCMLSGERPHIVFELPRGERLSKRIHAGGISHRHLLPTALDLCGVLQYLAHRGVAHLAVQPRNVALGTPPCLWDFTRARLTADPPSATRAPGGDPYLAPEQCDPRRSGGIGCAADVWGLGATLHEALSGRHPFPSDGAPFPQLRAAPRRLPNQVPGHVAAAIRACLATRPADRPTACELADALAPMASGAPPHGGRRYFPCDETDLTDCSSRPHARTGDRVR